MPGDAVLFYLFATLAVSASLFVIGQGNPIYSVLVLIVSFGALSGLYVLLDAPFVAVIQIIIYAGAIMVLFLFVVMLLNAPREATEETMLAAGAAARRFGALLAAVLVVEVGWTLTRFAASGGGRAEAGFNPARVGSVYDIGRRLFTEHAFAFEATSILILVAMVGAVVLAGRRGARP